ncbi:hypothetical protein C7S20_02385 [Christiangramia fulva]|uniref:Uncharacterized protein n=2 Tax=Christiangramia fulva TaxID=2126553 RepID=A0A2R3Z1R7_9FLAO|nr:hypothetical protein C7S20_02385 [Christiangramia fulva]
MVSMGIPAIIAVWGIFALGFDSINWGAAIIWGIAATIIFTLVTIMGKKMGMTRMDLLDLLGSFFMPPHSKSSRQLGMAIHLMNGALLGISWAYGTVLFSVDANWLTGLAWGIILWILALLMMSTLSAVHPAIKKGHQEDPGIAATNFGKMTPVGSLIGHIIFGVVLGFLYSYIPF